jgi:hypothetical protein
MLKRNGEECRFEVPVFPGRLSASEQRAYSTAIAAVGEQLRQYIEAADAVARLAKELPNTGKQPDGLVGEHLGTIQIKGAEGGQWQIRRSLFKTTRNELLLCSRQTGGGQDFGIVEKFDPDSAYARAQGSAELLITGNNVVLLLQDHVENECRVLEAFRHDLEASVEEVLAEKYPGENFSRVVKAISAQCNNRTTGNTPNIRPAKPGRAVTLRF